MRRSLAIAARLARPGLAGVTPSVTLAAAASGERLSLASWLGMSITCLAFHYFGILGNDIADVEVDRLTERRATSPLVTGEVSLRTAGAIRTAAMGVLVVLGLVSSHGYLLIVSTVLMSLYNRWGKRLVMPVVMDMVQGGSWAAYYLSLVGMFHAQSPLGTESFFRALALGVFFTIMNLAHGGVRDVVTDMRAGRSTTAIMLGIRYQGDRVRWTKDLARS